jgi:hypothetical protein
MTSEKKPGVKKNSGKKKVSSKKPKKDIKFKLKKEEKKKVAKEKNKPKLATPGDILTGLGTKKDVEETKAPKNLVPMPEQMPVTENQNTGSEGSGKSEEIVKGEIVKEELTRTAKFQEELRFNFARLLEGKLLKGKLSRDVAWKLFKESFDSMVEFVRTDSDMKLPLAGIGTFKIDMKPPRRPVKGGESKLAAYDAIPHLKWKPSDRYRKYLLKQVLGYEEE